MADQMVGAVPGEVLGTLADIMLKLKNGGLTADELKLFAKRENPFDPVVKPAEVPKPEPLWRKISEKVIAVNLDCAPRLPFDGAVVEEHIGSGWVEVHKRTDGLYINGRKVVLYLSNRQINSKYIRGYELREELSGKSVLNVNILDALYENIHLVPEYWKRDKDGVRLYIFFWGTIFRNPITIYLYVCGLCFSYDNVWFRSCYCSGDVWYNYRAALLA